MDSKTNNEGANKMSKIKNLTWNHTVLSENVAPHMISADRQVRTIEMRRARGKRVYILTIQETLTGDYCCHSII